MSQFSSFRDYIYKYLFPYYYQANDTYRDSSGRGILQRFIETCSQYLDTEVIADSEQKYPDDKYQPGLDNIVDLIDVDKTPDLFLNYLWEFLGEIPFAYGLIVQGKVYDKLDLESWVFTNPYLTKMDARQLLKYAISLYKIRGTSKFYEILGNYYGIKIELIETNEGGSPYDQDIVSSDDHLVLATYNGTVAVYTLGSVERRSPYFDSDCTSCLYFKLKIGLDPDSYVNVMNSGRVQAAIDVLVSIVEKYLPIQCKIATYGEYTEPASYAEEEYDDSFSIREYSVPGGPKVEIYPILV